MNNTGLEIEVAARKYLGAPFRHQGRSIRGLDCVGLIIKVGHDLDLFDYDFINYNKQPDPTLMCNTLSVVLEKQPFDLSARKPGYILHMAFFKHPLHLAIYTSKDTIIHSAHIYNKVAEHRLDTYWQQKVRGIYKYRST